MARQELFVNDTLIPLKEDVPVITTYTIADIREPYNRKSSGTKTIVIPGSKEVNKLFGHIFEIGIDGTFNPNLKAEAVLLVDTVPIITGIMQLIKINVADKDTLEYECCIHSSTVDLFAEWGDAKLEDLDLSIYNHNVTDKDLQWNSTGDSIVSSGSTTAYALGTGYVYPNIHYGGTYFSPIAAKPVFHASVLYPAIYAKTYIDKMFSLAGFRYTSNFFTGAFFKSLIIPYPGGPLNTVATTIFASVTLRAQTVPAFAQIGLRIIHPSGKEEIYRDDTWETLSATAKSVTLPNIELYLEPGTIVQVLIWPVTNDVSVDPGSSLFVYTGDYFLNAELTIGRAAAKVGDKISQIDREPYIIPYNSEVSDVDDMYSATTHAFTIPYNSIGSYIPKDVKLRDFFKSLVTMFNLYVQPDKDDPRLIRVEPFLDFYTSNSTVDWSDKLAIDKPMDITPMGELQAKTFLFTYATDGDYYNKDYTDEWSEIYGQKRVEVDNDFLKEEKKIEAGFAPTPIVGLTHSTMVVPMIVKQQPKTPEEENIFKGKIRILIYGGRKSLTNGQVWRHADASGYTERSEYAFAGHVNDPQSPTYDINFGTVQAVLYYMRNPGNYTDNNLYNKYWKQYMAEITDKDSKLVTAYFYLNPQDIRQLDFANYVFADKHIYRLHQVIDYEALDMRLAKVELLEIKNGVPFVQSTAAIRNRFPVPRFGEVLQKQTDIDAAGTSSLFDQPVPLVDSPGDGYVVQVLGVTTTVLGGTTAYGTNTNLQVCYESALGSPVMTDSVALTQTTGTTGACANCTGGTTIYPNQGLVAYVQDGNPEGGDAALRISVLYRLVPTGVALPTTSGYTPPPAPP